jgi:hypothetical protein
MQKYKNTRDTHIIFIELYDSKLNTIKNECEKCLLIAEN